MKPITKIILIIVTSLFTIAFLTMIAISISMKADYWGTTMGHEAYGFYSAALALTAIVGLPTIILWIVMWKQRKNKNAFLNLINPLKNTTMKQFLIFTILLLFFEAQIKSQTNKHNEPQLDIKISLIKDTFKVNEEINIEIVLTNNTKKHQKFLFDMPRSDIFGPSQTILHLKNTKTEKSVVEHGNKRVLESQIYDEVILKEYYTILNPKSNITRNYEIKDLAILKTPDNKLKTGTYTLQLTYYGNFSNKITFIVK
jgi:hypothetical protein